MKQFKLILFSLLLITIFACNRNGEVVEYTTTTFENINGHIVIKGIFNDKDTLKLIFDSGGQNLGLSKKVIENLNLEPDDQDTAMGPGGMILIPAYTDQSLKIGNIKIDSIRVGELPFEMGDIDGVVGEEILKRYKVKIDNDLHRIIIADNINQIPEPGISIDILDYKPVPIINASFTYAEVNYNADFGVDLGAQLEISLFTPFVNQNELIDKSLKLDTLKLRGVEGEFIAFESNCELVQISEYLFSDIKVILNQQSQGVVNFQYPAGIIGNKLVNKFNITFDYANNQLYLSPNQAFINSQGK